MGLQSWKDLLGSENTSFLPRALWVFCADPSPKHRHGGGECLAAKLKMLSLLLVDLMNGPWDPKAPSALAEVHLPSLTICWTNGKASYGCCVCSSSSRKSFFLPTDRSLSNPVSKESEHQLVTLPISPCTGHTLSLLLRLFFHRCVNQSPERLRDLLEITRLNWLQGSNA